MYFHWWISILSSQRQEQGWDCGCCPGLCGQPCSCPYGWVMCFLRPLGTHLLQLCCHLDLGPWRSRLTTFGLLHPDNVYSSGMEQLGLSGASNVCSCHQHLTNFMASFHFCRKNHHPDPDIETCQLMGQRTETLGCIRTLKHRA